MYIGEPHNRPGELYKNRPGELYIHGELHNRTRLRPENCTTAPRSSGELYNNTRQPRASVGADALGGPRPIVPRRRGGYQPPAFLPPHSSQLYPHSRQIRAQSFFCHLPYHAPAEIEPRSQRRQRAKYEKLHKIAHLRLCSSHKSVRYSDFLLDIGNISDKLTS